MASFQAVLLGIMRQGVRLSTPLNQTPFQVCWCPLARDVCTRGNSVWELASLLLRHSWCDGYLHASEKKKMLWEVVTVLSRGDM